MLTAQQILWLVVISWVALYLIVHKICKTLKEINDNKNVSEAYKAFMIKKYSEDCTDAK